MTQLITGHTQILAHLGMPTESFKAPMIYNPYFEAAGIDVVVVPMGCEPENFPEFLRLLFHLRNLRGALITMPHKMRVVDLLDQSSAAVQICGACNAVRGDEEGRLIGDMFDGTGFVRGLLRKGHPVAGSSAIVVGSGGVGSAIAAALAEAQIARLALYDSNPTSAQNLADRLLRHYPHLQLEAGNSDPAGFEIVVNATPLGMNATDPLPMNVDRISPTAFVGEVVLKAEETPFLQAVRAKGCATQVGVDMLFEQIPAYLEFFGLPTTEPETLRQLARIQY